MAAAHIRDTQNVIEYAFQQPPATAIRDTQNAIEWVEHIPGSTRIVRVCQACIEIAWPAATSGGGNGNGGGQPPSNPADRVYCVLRSTPSITPTLEIEEPEYDATPPLEIGTPSYGEESVLEIEDMPDERAGT